ncbi:MAG: hypothetical protein ACLU9S_24075 [Oscillospiraceae bacterium]
MLLVMFLALRFVGMASEAAGAYFSSSRGYNAQHGGLRGIYTWKKRGRQEWNIFPGLNLLSHGGTPAHLGRRRGGQQLLPSGLMEQPQSNGVQDSNRVLGTRSHWHS